MMKPVTAAILAIAGATAGAGYPTRVAVGQTAFSLTAKDRAGKTVQFPGEYRGKVVLLDFWGTRCPPCMKEAPNIARVYRNLHSKGFEILGICLDPKETLKNVGHVARAKGMSWNLVADGKGWDSPVAKKYGVEDIPQAYLVDGDTGRVIAEGDSVFGVKLLPAVQRALRAKRRR